MRPSISKQAVCLIVRKFGITVLTIKVTNNHDLRENQLSESHTLCMAVNKFLPQFFILAKRLG